MVGKKNSDNVQFYNWSPYLLIFNFLRAVANGIYSGIAAESHAKYSDGRSAHPLPGEYFIWLVSTIFLYMLLATCLKKAYVRYYGDLL
jgi:hypothetical protein